MSALDDRKILAWQFESFAHCSRQEEKPEAAACFDALASGIDVVPAKLFDL